MDPPSAERKGADVRSDSISDDNETQISPVHQTITLSKDDEIRRHSIGVFPNATQASSSNDERYNLSHKESFKARKETYKIKKKKVVKEFSSALKDKSVTILCSWLKIRGTLKSWAKYWCVVKPEVVIIYKNDKPHHWVGTILINNCEFFERPSSKDGFCFKIFQPYGQTIWATRGPKGELAAALVQPMPKDHLILRADNQQIGRCWLDALEVAQRSSLVQNPAEKLESDIYGEEGGEGNVPTGEPHQFDETFHQEKSDFSSAEEDETAFIACATEKDDIEETNYSVLYENEEFGESGETTEEMEEENKSILWALLKQVRPGMDLSKVTLPTFILEPRSFLDKLADYYYHSDLLANATREESPYGRIKEVVKWYLSGFYKKPKGLKKPYNPIIGEMFRCMWTDSQGASRTFFVAEQVSHHPPVSAFYCSNRKGGYAIGGSILAKSKFYGNSTSAILDGTALLTFLKLGEDYTVTMPYAHVKGILIGSLTAELGGIVCIKCEKTGYSAEIEFKLKPFWKKSGECNYVSGKIRMGSSVLAKIEGKWDGDSYITEYTQSNEESPAQLFFSPTPEVKRSRLKRFNVPVDEQERYESERLWAKVSAAIVNADQQAATAEKLVLEDEQRALHRELREKEQDWQPRYFERDTESMNEHAWIYKYRDLRAWDNDTDLKQFEHEGILKTQTVRKVAIVKRTNSCTNILTTPNASQPERLPVIKEPTDGESSPGRHSDRSSLATTRSEDEVIPPSQQQQQANMERLKEQLEAVINPLIAEQKETQKQLHVLRLELRKLTATSENNKGLLGAREILLFLLLAFLAYFVQKRFF